MAIEVGNIIRVTAVQNFAGVECLNVFFYEAQAYTVEPTYDDVSTKFQQFWTLYVKPVLSANNVLSLVKVENLSNGLEFLDDVVSIAGSIGGEFLPKFNGWTFRLVRTTKATRNGRKCFAGIAESQTTSNVPAAGVVPLLDTLAVQLATDLEESVGMSVDWAFKPVIIGRVNTTTPPADPVYELDLDIRNYVAGAQFTRISTQNSRKS